MANEPKNETKKTESTTPVVAPPPAAPSGGELAAAQAKLKALKEANELKLVQAEIDKIEAGGKGPLQMKAIREAEEKRAKTIHEGDLALYRLTEISYKALRPGGSVSLREVGTVIRIPLTRLPGASMEAVKRAPAAKADEFVSA
jgi:hypothetical protein